MKLPKRSAGFTMVELLIVISIIALLTTIAIGVYSGVQKNGRDARRRAEVDSLFKSIDSSKDPVSGVYGFTAANFVSDFPTPPADPGGAAWSSYCILTSTSTADTLTAPSPAAFSVPCPTSWVPVTNYLTPAPPFPTGTRGWLLCAKLESNSTLFCRASTNR